MRNIIFFLFLVSITVIGCSDSRDSQDNASVQTPKRDTLRINIGTEPPTLDWSKSTDSTSYTILINIMEGLTTFGKDYKPVPALAESWQISKDGTIYTFKLREDVKWSDGRPLVAKDFEYSWKRLLNPDTGADYAYFLYDIKNAEEYNTGKIKDPDSVGVKSLDDHTLQVILKKPASFFLSIVSFMSTFPMREDIVQQHQIKWTEPENIVTLGAYKLSSWKHHEKLTLAKNEKYWGDKPKINKVEMIMNENQSSALALYESGELDYVDTKSMPHLEIPRLRMSPDFRTQPQFTVSYLGFNVKKAPFDNPLVRKAFSAAINRQNISEVVQGGGIPTTSWIPKGMLAFNEDIGIDFDPERAKEFLKRAGFQSPADFPKTTFLYPDVRNNRIIAESLQSMWKEYLGVGVELINQEWKVYLDTLDTDPPHIYRAGWAADFPDPHNFMNLFVCNSGNNETGWCNPVYDNLVDTAAGELDENTRIELYNQAQTLLTETDVPIAPFLISIQQSMLKPYIQGLEPNPLGFIFFNRVSFKNENTASN
ncbi:MAG: peptide ABC transporter substrate-binding protein [Candidatus Dadabacteria bacterium]|nr:peptide ABC transporter substrate-binding protein [Candidatus Dadabacteria bacterium]NIS07554.1 peptide ABC transporter substrate-binding protein [Candidatus Dadabacteria bacterium]NIY21169.1 peptide ABC transporter substrate-binding protein [Candidatus Dadabacteria bacterium]